MNRKSFVRYQLPVFLWMGCIFGLSTISRMPEIISPIGVDKIVHTGFWFVLCWLAWRAFRYQEKFPIARNHALTLAIALSIVYGILDEVHQLYVPGRWADIYDAVADTTGALLFGLWLWFWTRRQRKKSANQSGLIDR